MARGGPAAAAAGWAEWAELPPEQARVGLVHAVSNIAAVSLHAASLAARLRGRDAHGRLLSVAGRRPSAPAARSAGTWPIGIRPAPTTPRPYSTWSRRGGPA
ncbi:hypothetical protein ACIQV2_10725 [Streptomyces globosus]|uniref:hypothetical protein n=1 Tax=Streptomyces globosus TaxID=68209 RepID=UPI0038229A86